MKISHRSTSSQLLVDNVSLAIFKKLHWNTTDMAAKLNQNDWYRIGESINIFTGDRIIEQNTLDNKDYLTKKHA